MIKYSITINGESRIVSNSDLNSLYENGKELLLKAKTIEDLERVRDIVRNRTEGLRRLRVIEGNDDVAQSFKDAYIAAFAAFVRDINTRIAAEKEALRKEDAKRQKGEAVIKEMLANAETMYNIGQKQSLIAILRGVKSMCSDFGIDIPEQYNNLIEKSISMSI